MKWAFIDYENVGSLGKVDLSSYERVIVFLGAKQPRLDFTDTKYDKPINLVVVQLKATVFFKIVGTIFPSKLRLFP